jgi:endo-1,4-beta-xylanase
LCGEDFISKAFEYAHAADPNAVLFYNDYNEINPVKRAKIIILIKKLRAAGVPVHAIGLQAHWSIYEPTKEQLIRTFEDFIALDMPLQITELDMSVYHKEQKDLKEKEEDIDSAFTEKRHKQQEKQYAMCFDVFRKYRKYITGVTFWDVSDNSSWLNNFPVKNRRDYPLLFDRKLQPKKAFWKVALFND